MSTLGISMFAAIGLILILIGATIAKQVARRRQHRPTQTDTGRTSLGKDLSEE